MHQVGDQSKVILRWTVNQPSRINDVLDWAILIAWYHVLIRVILVLFIILSSQRQSTIQLAEYRKKLHDLDEATVISET